MKGGQRRRADGAERFRGGIEGKLDRAMRNRLMGGGGGAQKKNLYPFLWVKLMADV